MGIVKKAFKALSPIGMLMGGSDKKSSPAPAKAVEKAATAETAASTPEQELAKKNAKLLALNAGAEQGNTLGSSGKATVTKRNLLGL